MAQIKASHILAPPAENCLSIFIPHSKTDIFRDGNTTFLTDSGDKFSPKKILKCFMASVTLKSAKMSIYSQLCPSIQARHLIPRCSVDLLVTQDAEKCF